ncbi:pyridoxal-phosphate dependent enzyme [Bosea caraganae]|uniref:Pyridoxal-phosphate dependent enzyme n=1 Tax=Bosea caraganae TaxID=2763117 RepID=A0A370LCQ8_9HYPH|nr:pyridoxal-phosphate dependent enzyme [Bosea caraganae]RDJ27744.1 pyridoxal-phosphate dependent enzyme [Bosea caraganae]RDJ29757.1 pyridoxal-phosphate dependent enzyme [Bosea caraganae]
MRLRCVECGATFEPLLIYRCSACGGILETDGSDDVAPFAFGEGRTPLLRASRIEATLSGFSGEIWLKDETRNPSGSFKDRLISAALGRAIAMGVRGVVCASSGNAGAATAAYAARAGMPAIIVVPAHTPIGKVTQISAHGAILLLVEGHYSRSYDLARALAEEHGFANLTTTFINPYAVAGLTQVGTEIFAQLGNAAPSHVLIPTGSGPLVKGVWQGLADAGATTRLVAVQAAGCAPIVRAFEAGAAQVTAWGMPDTIASGISDPLIGYERDGTYTLRLVRESGGLALAVSDDALRAAMQNLARLEGVYAEPTGASPIAALPRLLADGHLPAGSRVVCLITGHGFKDGRAYQEMPAHTHRVEDPGDTAAVARLCEAAMDGQNLTVRF